MADRTYLPKSSMESTRSQTAFLRSPTPSSPGVFPSTPGSYSAHRRSSSITSSTTNLGNGYNFAAQASTNGGKGVASRNSIADLVPDSKPSKVQQYRPPSQKDIPSVTLAQINKLKKQEFSPYLTTVSGEYQEFCQNKMRSGGTQQGIKTSRELTALSTVPDVFFEQNFQLDNPRIFDIVSEKSDIVRTTEEEEEDNDQDYDDSTKILANNTILQERLAWYIDTVELHLINEISNASTSFFSALDDLNSIKSQAWGCIESITRLKQDLKVVGEKRAKAGIENLKLKQRKRNVSILAQSLEQIALVFSKSDEAQALFKQERVGESLDTIDAVETLIAGNTNHRKVKQWVEGWEHSIVDLRPVKGLGALFESLCDLRNDTGKSYGQVFATTLVDDLRRHYESVKPESTMARLTAKRGEGVNTGYEQINEEFKESVLSCFEGLVRSDNVAAAFGIYRSMVMKESKGIVRMNLPSQSDTSSMGSSATTSSTADKSSSLKSVLVNMSAQAAETMIRDMYTALSELFRRMTAQQKMLFDIASKADSSDQLDIVTVSEDIRSVLPNAVNLSIERLSKLLKVRQARMVEDTKLQEFINYFMLNHLFLNECEQICGDFDPALRNMMTNQIKSFVQTRHHRASEILQMKMEGDNWKDAAISEDFQHLVERMVQSAQQTPENWAKMTKQVIDGAEATTAAAQADDDPDKTSRQVRVEDRKFIVPHSAVYVIRYLEEYMITAYAMPHMARDVAKNINILLERFHKNVLELILQARAVKIEESPLKHITAKHLSLASEALNFVAELLPYIREALHRQFQSPVFQSSLNDIDDTRRAMQELIDRIRDKFVNLMDDRMAKYAQDINKVDWSLETSEVHPYMTSMVKDISVLVRIVGGILPHQSYLDITGRIFDIYKRRLLDEFTKVEFHTSVEKRQMLQDVEYFRSKLSHIEGAGNACEVIWENIRAMPAPDEPNPETQSEESMATMDDEKPPATPKQDGDGDGDGDDDDDQQRASSTDNGPVVDPSSPPEGSESPSIDQANMTLDSVHKDDANEDKNEDSREE